VRLLKLQLGINWASTLGQRPSLSARRTVFRSDIWLITASGRFSALSLLEVMRANLDCGSIATLEARGPDAERAIAHLTKVVHEMKDYED
jgi:phosphotransferase system HPr-like phosphotransfer protein